MRLLVTKFTILPADSKLTLIHILIDLLGFMGYFSILFHSFTPPIILDSTKMKQENLYILSATALSAAVPVVNNPIRLPQIVPSFSRRGF